MVNPLRHLPRASWLGPALALVGYLLLAMAPPIGAGPHLMGSPLYILGAGLFCVGIALCAARAIRFCRANSHPTRRALLAAGAIGLVCTLIGIWRILTGAAAEWRFGESIVFRDWLLLAYPDVSIVGGLMALGWVIGKLRDAAPFGSYAGAAIGILVVANVYFFGAAWPWIAPFEDSPNYLGFHACRTPGYFFFLTPFLNFEPSWLVIVQINLVLLAKLAISAAIYWLTGSAMAGIASALLAAVFSASLITSFAVLTEPAFSAVVGFAIAASIAYLRTPTRAIAAAVGLSLAAAIMIKAVAPVLIAAAAALLLMPARHYRTNALLLIGVPIASLAAVVAISRFTHGAWSPTFVTGYQLAAVAGPGIRSDKLSSDPDLSRRIEEVIRPIREHRPPRSDVRGYLRATSKDIFHMFGAIMTLVQPNNHDPQTGMICSKEINQALMRVGIESVIRYPLQYFADALVHVGGFWALALEATTWRHLAQYPDYSALWSSTHWDVLAMPDVWRGPPSRLRQITDRNRQYHPVPLLLDTVKAGNAQALQILSLVVGFLSVAALALLPWLARLKAEYAALVVISLYTNIYFFGHGMFSAALPRYATLAEIPAVAFMVIGALAAGRLIVRLFRPARPSQAVG